MSGLFNVVVANGGLTLLVIMVASMLALAVTVERLWRLLPQRRVLRASRAAVVSALLARQTPVLPEDAMGRVLGAGLAVRGHGHEVVRLAALDAAQREVPALERGLGVLLVTAQVATLLGLLGTVVGLIESLQSTSSAAVVTPAVIADGLYKALGCTVAGLWVAIPAYIAYGYLASLSSGLADQLEHAATDLPVLLLGTRA